MPYFKSLTNQLYFLDDAAHAEKSLPAGSVQITDAEAAVLGNFPNALQAAQLARTQPPAPMGDNNSLIPAYNAALAQPVSYTSVGGVTKFYQADSASIDVLHKEVTLYSTCVTPASTPKGYYWVAADNTQVPFTLDDLKGLAAAIGAQGVAAFQRLQVAKAAVKNAATIDAVNAVQF